MSKCGTSIERHLHAMEHPPRLHHRHVERLAVVGDEESAPSKHSATARQQRALGGIAGEQELPDLERAEIEAAAADQERDRPGAAAQAGCFEIDEQRARQSGARPTGV